MTQTRHRQVLRFLSRPGAISKRYIRKTCHHLAKPMGEERFLSLWRHMAKNQVTVLDARETYSPNGRPEWDRWIQGSCSQKELASRFAAAATVWALANNQLVWVISAAGLDAEAPLVMAEAAYGDLFRSGYLEGAKESVSWHRKVLYEQPNHMDMGKFGKSRTWGHFVDWPWLRFRSHPSFCESVSWRCLRHIQGPSKDRLTAGLVVICDWDGVGMMVDWGKSPPFELGPASRILNLRGDGK